MTPDEPFFVDIPTVIDFAGINDTATEPDEVAGLDGVSKNLAIACRETVDKFTCCDSRKVKSACEVLRAMPEPGESVHVIVGQMFAGFDLLPAFLSLTGAAGFKTLYMTTLGYSVENLDNLGRMIGSGQIDPKRLSILCGDFFRKADRKIWAKGVGLAVAHGFTFKSHRSHTKLILAEIAGKFYVVESSANLRSCHNIEFFTVTQSKTLFDFHAKWIEDLLPFAKD